MASCRMQDMRIKTNVFGDRLCNIKHSNYIFWSQISTNEEKLGSVYNFICHGTSISPDACKQIGILMGGRLNIDGLDKMATGQR